MLNFFDELDHYLKSDECQDVIELRKVRRNLYDRLQMVDKKLDAVDGKNHISGKRCSACNSSHINIHAQKPSCRFLCQDCGHSFGNEQSSLYYRRRNPKKILDFIIAIYQTNKSISEIKSDLEISSPTYYKWRMAVLNVLPQLAENFAQRSKKAGKLPL